MIYVQQKRLQNDVFRFGSQWARPTWV